MAIDTRSRRASALRAFRPWVLALPLADGAVGQADREHTAFGYAGILSAAAAAEGPFKRLYATSAQAKALYAASQQAKALHATSEGGR